MSDHIEQLTIKDYGPIKDVTVRLTPLHAFIGPNDSGKSTLLRAMRTAVQLAGSSFTVDEHDRPLPFDPGMSWDPLHPSKEAHIEVSRQNVVYRVYEPDRVAEAGAEEQTLDFFDFDEEILVDGQKLVAKLRRARSASDKKWDRSALRSLNGNPSLQAYKYFMRGAQMLRLDPNALREPGPLIVGSFGAGFAGFKDERGRGLPGVYDVILNQKVQGFLAIQERVRALFPGIEAIGLENVSPSMKELRAQVSSGEWISARFLSEGLLYYLAFAALQHLGRPAVLLVEEPENGLHPARIADVMGILREISRETQVLIATHSPLVVNELQPDEVSVVTRTPEAGTKVTRVVDTPGFAERVRGRALGDFWIAYANGADEAPLFADEAPLFEPQEP